MSVSGSTVAAHYKHQVDALARVISGYEQLATELAEQLKTVGAQRVAARAELASVYLPELSDAAFARTTKLTGFLGFERRDPRQAIEHERKVLQTAIAKIESSDRFARRDELVGPTGTLTQELDSAKDTLASLQAECDRFESQDGFLELVRINYDTPRFTEKWWSASYWKHWATGDRICKALGLSDFGDDVLPAYNKSAEPRNFMREEVKRIDREIDAVHALVQERDQAQARIANLEQIYLEEAQQFLGEHLENADAALLEKWAAAEPDLLRAVQIGVRKLSGLSAKMRFITEIANGIQGQFVPDLRMRREKAFQKSQKFQRPKYAYGSLPDTLINRDFDDKVGALDTQRQKLSKRVNGLVAAENYAGFDMRNDQELWWLYFMQSAPPRFAPSLYDYYQRRPDAAPLTDPDFVDLGPTPGEAAATAYAAGDLEQGTYLS